MRSLRTLSIILFALILTACGGGGGGSDPINMGDTSPTPSDLGPWGNTPTSSLQEVNTGGGTAQYGVRHMNGETETFDSGPMPTVPISQSGIQPDTTWQGEVRSYDFVTWRGDLVGFTDQGSPVEGDTTISIEIDSMQGRAEFTGLTTGNGWNRDELSVWIDVDGNRIWSGEGDPWTEFEGHFRGTGHEAVTGSFRYEGYDSGNLTAAFGASRQ